jgi:hypothetical protein
VARKEILSLSLDGARVPAFLEPSPSIRGWRRARTGCRSRFARASGCG